jgi:hypothetical protein
MLNSPVNSPILPPGLPSPITTHQAACRGLKPLTNPYYLGEEKMLQRVVSDLVGSGIEYALVLVDSGVEVWRGRNGNCLNAAGEPYYL